MPVPAAGRGHLRIWDHRHKRVADAALERHTLNGRHLCANRKSTDLLYHLRKSLENLHLNAQASSLTAPIIIEPARGRDWLRDYTKQLNAKRYSSNYNPDTVSASSSSSLSSRPSNSDRLHTSRPTVEPIFSAADLSGDSKWLQNANFRIHELEQQLEEEKAKGHYLRARVKEVFVGALPSSTQIPDIGRTAGKHRHSRTYQDEINTLDEQLVNIDAELDNLTDQLRHKVEKHSKRLLLQRLDELLHQH